MPLLTNTLPREDEIEGLDPDNPVDDQSFVGRFTVTARVDVGSKSVVPSYGPEDDARILTTCEKFFEKYGYAYAAWYLEAEGISVVRIDGTPWRQHEILKLQSKDGKSLGKNQAHGELAKAFLDQGVSASYAKAGQDGSAYGRVIEFGSHTVGKKPYEKTLRLWPKQVFDEGYVYDGEVREITPKSQDEADAGVPIDGGASAAKLSEPEVVEILCSILHGVNKTDMLNVILEEPRLRGVATVFGVPIVESATDESLADVLSENKAMTVSGGGVLQRA